MRALWDEGWAVDLERDHDAHLADLIEAEGEMVDETGTPFCGCEVCVRRASWAFLIARVVQGVRDGLVELEDR